MKIMLDCSPAKIAEYSRRYDHQFWQLRTPLTAYKVAGVPYGIDNGCYTQFERKTWERLLNEAEELACRFDNPLPPKFVCLPDIVGNARRTLDLFDQFKKFTNGFPRALVLQDGIGDFAIPWDDIACVFVGGSDYFKSSPEALDACRAAKMLGKWVHVGRVNTAGRVRNWIGLADSVDGSGISRYDHMLEDCLSMIDGTHPQTELLA